jgi:hypothetical protein
MPQCQSTGQSHVVHAVVVNGGSGARVVYFSVFTPCHCASFIPDERRRGARYQRADARRWNRRLSSAYIRRTSCSPRSTRLATAASSALRSVRLSEP